ncbi:MAG: hypothetical protein K0Q95_511 [Bacteroidota bacterium]|jgi:hypothetical protein|nr:hypothetical protein [Bacteroidota bacterium]
MNKTLLILAILFIGSNFLFSRTCTSGSGTYTSWNAAAWSCTPAPVGGPPLCNDNIIVQGNIQISADVDYSGCPSPIILTINGVMDFNTNGVRFQLPSGSTVILNAGARVEKTFAGGGSSTLISIGGSNVWTAGDGTYTGPMVLGTPLPIDLISFTAAICEKGICLNWITASETNNDYFEIEKTVDGFTYENIGTVKGAGNSSSIRNYLFTDHYPYDGTSYYRLKQTDYNGRNTYSSLEYIDFNSTGEFSFVVYPNPNNGQDISLVVEGDDAEEILVVVTDITGNYSYSKVLVKGKTQKKNVFALDPSKKLPAGMYLITATSKQSVVNKKLIVN